MGFRSAEIVRACVKEDLANRKQSLDETLNALAHSDNEKIVFLLGIISGVGKKKRCKMLRREHVCLVV